MKNKINFKKKFNLFSDYWTPKVIAEMNNYQFKLVKVKGEFISHKHDHTDEAFIVIDGSLKIEFSNKTINLNSGEMFVVPKGVKHKPYSKEECKILIVEPRETINTGNVQGKYTAILPKAFDKYSIYCHFGTTEAVDSYMFDRLKRDGKPNELKKWIRQIKFISKYDKNLSEEIALVMNPIIEKYGDHL